MVDKKGQMEYRVSTTDIFLITRLEKRNNEMLNMFTSVDMWNI
jgi:hypothetical protein